MTNNGTDKTDHDLLIELNTKVELWHGEQVRMISDAMGSTHRELAILDNKVVSSHSRMDRLDREFNNLGTLKDRVLGGAVVLMFLFSSAITILSIIKK